MHDLYLKFATEDQASEALFYVMLDDEGGVIETLPRYRCIDVIGTLYDVVDEMTTPLEGWHVNVRLMDGEDPAPLEPYAVQPTHPRRVFA